jgi:hypothetical protein
MKTIIFKFCCEMARDKALRIIRARFSSMIPEANIALSEHRSLTITAEAEKLKKISTYVESSLALIYIEIEYVRPN